MGPIEKKDTREDESLNPDNDASYCAVLLDEEAVREVITPTANPPITPAKIPNRTNVGTFSNQNLDRRVMGDIFPPFSQSPLPGQGG
jgi:hypothetical protein